MKLRDEKLVVAYVRYNYFSWLGWPYGEASIDEIDEVIEYCSDEEHRKLLERLIESPAECGRYAYQDLLLLNRGYVGENI